MSTSGSHRLGVCGGLGPFASRGGTIGTATIASFCYRD
jgi:hypothetical protein